MGLAFVEWFGLSIVAISVLKVFFGWPQQSLFETILLKVAKLIFYIKAFLPRETKICYPKFRWVSKQG